MNQIELARLVAEDNGITYTLATNILKSMTGIIMKSIKIKEEVNFIGFGKFVPFVRHAREGVNPQKPTERIHMPEVLTVKFRAGSQFKRELKK